MKKNGNHLKTFLVNALVFSLLQTQTYTLAYALDASDVGMATNILGQVGSNILNTKAQVVQQQIYQQQMMNIQKQLQPNYSASKYFSECKLPNTMQNLPVNACQVTNNPNQIGTMYGYEAAAQNLINFYDQMMNEATPATGSGVACLNNSKKKFDDQLTEMINNLTRLQTQLKEESQIFREANKAILNEMEETNLELMGAGDGGSARNSISGKTRDFTKIVSPACQKVLGGNVSTEGNTLGFNGLLKIASTKNSAAYNYSQSKGQIETEIKAQVQNLKDAISEVGLDNWVASNGSSRSQINIQDKLSSYAGLSKMIMNEKQSLLAQKSRIANEIKGIQPDFEVPSMDKNSSSDLGNFINGSQDYFRKKYVNDCTLSSSKGVAISIDKIIGSIEQKNTDNSPAAINGYKEALSNILNSDSYVSDKLEQIKALENTYKGMTITYNNGNGSVTTQTPYELISATESACETKYSEDQTFSKSKANGLSEKEKTKRVQALLQEYKNLQDTFSAKMGNNIVNTLINCNGESLKATDSCNEDSLDPAKSNSFCVAKATACANNMLSCYTEINNQVETRKAKMNTLSKKFNTNVQNMVARANTLFKAQAANVESLAKLIQQKFPGSNFEIEKDLFVKLPETSKNKFGIEMAADGNLDEIINALPQKIESLRTMFATQKDTADKEIEDYVGKQKEAMSKEKSRFEKLYSECKSAADQSAQNIAKANQKGQEDQAKLDDKVKKFCTKYSGLKTNPNGACKNIDKLADEASDISQRLDKGALNVTFSFRNMCNESNNENTGEFNCDDLKNKGEVDKYTTCVAANKKQSNSGSSTGPKKLNLKIGDICDDKETKNDVAVDSLLSRLPSADKANLPKNTKNEVDTEEIAKYLRNKSTNSTKKLLDEVPFIKWLKTQTYSKDSDSICVNLLKKVNEQGTDDTPAQKALKEAQTAFDAATTAASDAKIKADNCTKECDSIKADVAILNNKIAPLQTKLEAAKTAAGSDNSSYPSKEEKFNKKLADNLNELSLRDTADTNGKSYKLSKLGEQVSDACDAQNSSMVAQKDPFAFDLKSWDSGKMSSGASR